MTILDCLLSYFVLSYPINVMLIFVVTKHKDVAKLEDEEIPIMFWLSPIVVILTSIILIYTILELITRFIKYILR